MVGYCANRYHLWCPEEKKIILGRDIIFNESKYSFNEDFYKTTPADSQDKDTSAGEFTQNTKGNENSKRNENSSISEGSEVFESAVEEKVDQNENSSLSDDPQKTTNSRCSTRVKTRSKYLDDYIGIALNAEAFVDDAPEDNNDIKGREDKDKWYNAVQEEITSLLKNNT